MNGHINQRNFANRHAETVTKGQEKRNHTR